MNDIYSNKLLVFQQKYALLVIGLWAYVIPTIVPMYFWNESEQLVAHLYDAAAQGTDDRPFDKNIRPVENVAVSIFSTGECFHNYHHEFPFDYKASEPEDTMLNAATVFIISFAWVGWAYDLQGYTGEDGHSAIAEDRGREEPVVWWGDKDQTEEETKNVEFL